MIIHIEIVTVSQHFTRQKKNLFAFSVFSLNTFTLYRYLLFSVNSIIQRIVALLQTKTATALIAL